MESDILKVLNEIYDAYKGAIEEASSIWISEFSYNKEDEERRNIEDKEDLKYFESLLQKINNNFHGEESNAR